MTVFPTNIVFADKETTTAYGGLVGFRQAYFFLSVQTKRMAPLDARNAIPQREFVRDVIESETRESSLRIYHQEQPPKIQNIKTII